MGVVVCVVGVHWLLLQTLSHVAGIQLKVLEAGDRSSQVGLRSLRGAGLDPSDGCFQEWKMQREHSPLAGEGDECTEEGMERRTESTWGFSLSTCLGAHRNIPPVRSGKKDSWEKEEVGREDMRG